MLILTRKTGQGFTLGGDIEITVTEISGDKVRIGINAPKDIKILRSELSETVESNQQAAGAANASSMRALAKGLMEKVDCVPPTQQTQNGAEEEPG